MYKSLKKSFLKANLDQQKKVLQSHVKKYCSLVQHTETSQTDLGANQLTGFYIIDKHCKVKG